MDKTEKKEVKMLKDETIENLGKFLRKSVELTTKDELPADNSTYLAGHPFVPASRDDWRWPKNNKGKRIPFVGQINFSELPESEVLADYPKTGMVQLFVSLGDNVMTRSNKGVKALYYTEEEIQEGSRFKNTHEWPEDVDNDLYENLTPIALSYKDGLQMSYSIFNDALDMGAQNEILELEQIINEKYPEDKDLMDLENELDPAFDFSSSIGGVVYRASNRRYEDYYGHKGFFLQIDRSIKDDLFKGSIAALNFFADFNKVNEGYKKAFTWEFIVD